MIKSKIKIKIAAALLAITASGGVFSFVSKNISATASNSFDIVAAKAETSFDLTKAMRKLRAFVSNYIEKADGWNKLTQGQKDSITGQIDDACGRLIGEEYDKYYDECFNFLKEFYTYLYNNTVTDTTSGYDNYTKELYGEIKAYFEGEISKYEAGDNYKKNFDKATAEGYINAYVDGSEDKDLYQKELINTFKNIYDTTLKKYNNLSDVDAFIKYYSGLDLSNLTSAQKGEIAVLYTSGLKKIEEAGVSESSEYENGEKAYSAEAFNIKRAIAIYEVENAYAIEAEGNFKEMLTAKKIYYTTTLRGVGENFQNVLEETKAEAFEFLAKMQEFYSNGEETEKAISDKFDVKISDETEYEELRDEFTIKRNGFIGAINKELSSSVAIEGINEKINSNNQTKAEAFAWFDAASAFFSERDNYFNKLEGVKESIEERYADKEISEEQKTLLLTEVENCESTLRGVTYERYSDGFAYAHMNVLVEKVSFKAKIYAAYYMYMKGASSLSDGEKDACKNKSEEFIAKVDGVEISSSDAVKKLDEITDEFGKYLTSVTERLREEKLGEIGEVRSLIVDGMSGENKAELEERFDALDSAINGAVTPDEINERFSAAKIKTDVLELVHGYYKVLLDSIGFTDREKEEINRCRYEDLLKLFGKEDSSDINSIVAQIKVKTDEVGQLNQAYNALFGASGFTYGEKEKLYDYKYEDIKKLFGEDSEESVESIIIKIGVYDDLRIKYAEFNEKKGFLKVDELNKVNEARLEWIEQIRSEEDYDSVYALTVKKLEKILSFASAFEILNEEEIFGTDEKVTVNDIRKSVIVAICGAGQDDLDICAKVCNGKLDALNNISGSYGNLNANTNISGEVNEEIEYFRGDLLKQISDAETSTEISGIVSLAQKNIDTLIMLVDEYAAKIANNDFSEGVKSLLEGYRLDDVKKICAAKTENESPKIYSLSKKMLEQAAEVQKAYLSLNGENFEEEEIARINDYLIADMNSLRAASTDAAIDTASQIGQKRASAILELRKEYVRIINGDTYSESNVAKITESYKKGVKSLGDADSIEKIDGVLVAAKDGMDRMPIYQLVLWITIPSVSAVILALFLLVFCRCKIIYRLPDNEKTVFAVRHSFPGRRLVIADIPERDNYDVETGRLTCENGVFELEGIYKNKALTKPAKKRLKMRLKPRNFYLKFTKVETPVKERAVKAKTVGSKAQNDYRTGGNSRIPAGAKPERKVNAQQNRRNGR